MSIARRYLALAAVLGALAAVLPPLASSETTPTVEAVNVGLYTHYWSPSQVSVAAGGLVSLSNPTTVAHGVEWVGGPAKPACSGEVPVGSTPAASGTKWSGTCTFSEAGTYTFYCTVHGPEMTGTVTVTIPGAPAASTGEASAVSETEATLKGTVNPEGKATTYFFNYGTSSSYGQKATEESAGEGSAGKPVSGTGSSLSPGTTYHFQLVAKNTAGTTLGVDRTFTTASPPGPPIATTGLASGVGETEATLKGTVNPAGQATTYLFEWGPSNTYGQSTAELPAGEDHAGHVESATLTGLSAGTVYHFRLVAKNASGKTPGTDQMFTSTSPPPASPPPTTTSGGSPPTATQSTRTPAATLFPAGPIEPPSGSPLTGGPSLRANQHGSSIHGSLDVSQSGGGGRLEVDLLAKSASLARGGRSRLVRVGRLVRAAVSAGSVSFSVALSARGRSALRRHRRLALTVEITLTPTAGAPLVVRRTVLLRA
jgi:plastocyanin